MEVIWEGWGAAAVRTKSAITNRTEDPPTLPLFLFTQRSYVCLFQFFLIFKDFVDVLDLFVDTFHPGSSDVEKISRNHGLSWVDHIASRTDLRY